MNFNIVDAFCKWNISSEIILFQFAMNTSISIISGMLKSCSESFRIYYYYRVINVSDFVSFTL